jgi:carbonic anhydrase/acetyltransferase-like protein (isoleucine patch superfamily)
VRRPPGIEPLVLPFRGKRPRIAPEAFLAPGCVVVGDVEIGPGASIWFGCVLRGDVERIRIGARTNIQDATVVHVRSSGIPALVGAGVTVGHGCILHACTVEDGAFVGMGATLMDGVVVEPDGMVAAGALVLPRERIPRGELWGGRPARRMRELRAEELDYFRELADHYAALGGEYLRSR